MNVHLEEFKNESRVYGLVDFSGIPGGLASFDSAVLELRVPLDQMRLDLVHL